MADFSGEQQNYLKGFMAGVEARRGALSPGGAAEGSAPPDAMRAAQDAAVVARRDIASHLGVDTTALSMARQSLLDKGILDAPAHGRLAFSVPGFGRYVRSLTEPEGTRGSSGLRR